jgi:ferric-dicitrate binding protein FerR (iron transport regulator)
MSVLSLSGTCERARAWSSRRLDGELSELETTMLDRHLELCQSCARFVEDTARATELLRQTPLERVASEIVVTRRRRRRSRVLRTASGLAAACVVFVTAGITVSREMRYQSQPDLRRSPIEQRLFTEQPKLGSDSVHVDDLYLPPPGVQRTVRDGF